MCTELFGWHLFEFYRLLNKCTLYSCIARAFNGLCRRYARSQKPVNLFLPSLIRIFAFVFAPDDIFRIGSAAEFERAALELFRFQAARCTPYGEYLARIGVRAESVCTLHQIPFLPIGLFKSHDIYCGEGEPEAVFTSSATTGMTCSRGP